MLTDQDIDKLIAVLATKNDVEEIRGDLSDLKELVQGLIISSDKLSKAISELGIEYVAINMQMARHEAWIKQIAEQIGLQLSKE